MGVDTFYFEHLMTFLVKDIVEGTGTRLLRNLKCNVFVSLFSNTFNHFYRVKRETKYAVHCLDQMDLALQTRIMFDCNTTALVLFRQSMCMLSQVVL